MTICPEARATADRLLAALDTAEGDASLRWSALPFFARSDDEGLTPWQRLYEKLAADPRPWQPAPDLLLRALALTPRARTRAVILGQDPYHTPGRARGLAFSFPPGETPRDSLRNILTELASDTGSSRPDGDLAPWAQQGVLLLNTLLSVPLGTAFGHRGLGWEGLTQQILAATAADGPRAFLLWGGPAAKLCAKLPREPHLFIESAHPSPLSAYRGFFGSRPFSAVNAWLEARGETAIDWGA